MLSLDLLSGAIMSHLHNATYNTEHSIAEIYKLIVSDSICKRLNDGEVKNTGVAPFSGKKASDMIEKVLNDTLNIRDYKAVLWHFGTNDIYEVLFGPWHLRRSENRFRHAWPSVQDVRNTFTTLMDCVRDKNREGKMLWSSILPRVEEFEQTHSVIEQINDHIQQQCCRRKGFIYVQSYKYFIDKRSKLPVRTYFGVVDWLHPNAAGVFRLKKCFQQALSDKNLATECHWKRRPSGKPVQQLRQPVVRGASIQF